MNFANVSVIIPAYNQAKFLPMAIESVIHQIYQDWHLTVVVDASPDNSEDIAKTYQNAYPDKISILNLKQNLGLSGARMKGVQLGWDSRYILFVDSVRNDAGRVADYGSVEVSNLMAVERSSQALFLASNLKAVLRVGCDRFDALAAAFPAG